MFGLRNKFFGYKIITKNIKSPAVKNVKGPEVSFREEAANETVTKCRRRVQQSTIRWWFFMMGQVTETDLILIMFTFKFLD